MAYIYICLQCPAGEMTRGEAKAHLHNEGHEVEEEWVDDETEDFYEED